MRLKTALVLPILLSFAFVSQSFSNTPINDEHLVTSGETLRSIAELKKPDEVSIWQVMDGIYKANKFLFEKILMDISEGTKLIIPNNSFFLEQNGFYVADTLGLDAYQRENMKASINKSKINNIFESTNKVDEIPYFLISDLDQSEVINNIKGCNYDQIRTLTIESDKNLIEQLNSELKLLQREHGW